MTDLAYICSWRTEIAALIAITAWGIVHLAWAATASRRQQGLKWARGNRDQARPVTGAADRLNRAYANFMETYPFFAAAVLILAMTEAWSTVSQIGALMYVGARVLYVPVYASGTESGLRTLIWFVGFAGLLMVIAAVLMGGGSPLPALRSA